MTKVRLLKGPCDPRDVEMLVSDDAESLSVRPMPFDVYDVYVLTERFREGTAILVATAEYTHTTGSRPQLDAYRRALAKLGTGRAFALKRPKRATKQRQVRLSLRATEAVHAAEWDGDLYDVRATDCDEDGTGA